jgi:hypothetical protein
MSPPATTPIMSYHQQRMRRCRVALAAWLHRWGAYVVATGLLLAVGADSPLAVLGAAVGALVLPLFQAATPAAGGSADGQALLLMGTAAYALIGALPVVMTRPLWWPAGWAMAEHALPLAPQTLRQSDRRLLAWLVLPWQALLWLGAAALLANNPALADRHGALALLALAMAGAGAAVLGLCWMQRVRQRALRWPDTAALRPAWPRHAASPSLAALAGPPAAQAQRWLPPPRRHGLGWRHALLWLPLWRGLARRTAHALLVGGLATPALAAAPLAAPAATGWWLAALALVALGSTALLRARSRDELAALWQGCRSLPLAPAQLDRSRRRLTLAPALAATLLAAPTLLHVGARPLVALGYLAMLLLGCTLESRPPPPEPSHHASRWLLSLVLAIVLGSEAMP